MVVICRPVWYTLGITQADQRRDGIFSMQPLLYVALALALLGDVLLTVILILNLRARKDGDTAELRKALQSIVESETDLLADQLRATQAETARTTQAAVRDLGALLAENQRQGAAASTARLEAIDRAGAARQKAASDASAAQLALLEARLKGLEDSNAARLDGMRGALVQGLNAIRADNNRRLDEIRATVDENLQDALQKRISDSFRTVSAQLEQVYKGLGEMQNLATDVGGLKKVLSGVKTRGILGEVQLGAILEDILAPGQYARNVATVPGSANRVEYAVKLPGQGGTVWLPIDAKFPGDTYARLVDARESGDTAAIAAARKQLEAVLRQEAKDIHDKYIQLPHTTAFGVLFLPFEGLYAEVIRNPGLIEELQSRYKVVPCGPTTISAILNSLQLGFRTLAIQRSSKEVFDLLAAFRKDFEKFVANLDQAQRQVEGAGRTLEDATKRTAIIMKKLKTT